MQAELAEARKQLELQKKQSSSSVGTSSFSTAAGTAYGICMRRGEPPLATCAYTIYTNTRTVVPKRTTLPTTDTIHTIRTIHTNTNH